MMLGWRNVKLHVTVIFMMMFEMIQVSKQACSVTETNITASATSLSTLTSSGYNAGSGTYVSNMDCWWIIDSGADDLKIIMYFTLDTACPNDVINIYDGSLSSSAKLGNNQCGTKTVDYASTQRYVRIEMTSDGATEQAGFKVEYTAVKDYSGTGCASSQTLTATEDYQFLSSQNFPESYASDSDCRWNLYYPYGVVEMDVILADMEDDGTPSSCDFDKYQIFDGENKCDNNVAREICSEFSKTSPYTLTSNGTNIVVTLSSDDSVEGRGFYLRYRGVTMTTSSSGTTATTSAGNTSNSTGIQINLQFFLGIIFGSIILLCFIIMTVVCVVKRIQIPLEKTVTTRVQPMRGERPSIDSTTTVRSRKPSKSKVLSPNTLKTVSRLSDTRPTRPPPYSRGKPRVIQNRVPPRGGGSNQITDTCFITDF